MGCRTVRGRSWMGAQRARLLFGVGAAVAGLVGAQSAPDTEWRVQRRDVVRDVTLSGELQVVEQVQVTSPRAGTDYTSAPISYLAPEGSLIQPGELLVEFDGDALETQLREAEVGRENARLEVARREAEHENQRQDQLLIQARAVKTRRIAEIYAGLDPSLMPRGELEKHRFDLEKATVEEEKAVRRLQTLQESGRSDLQVARLDEVRAALRVERLKGDIERLSVRAPIGGMVIYSENPSTANKVQVGDQLFAGFPVVQLPSLEAFKVSAICYDPDYHALQIGAAVEVTLDAVPGRSFSGTIASLSEVARAAASPVLRTKVFQVEVLLADNDPARMRPGMTARVRVPVTYRQVLAVPREAVTFGPGPGAFVRPASSGRNVPIEIIDASAKWVVVEGPIEPGTLLERPGWAGEPQDSRDRWVEATTTELAMTASATGTLQAARALQVTPPPVPFVSRFKIVALAPEGATVAAGEPVVRFDATEIERRLAEDRDSLEKNRREVEKLEATQQLRVGELEMELETARVEVDRALAKNEQARQFQGLIEARETTLELEFARTHVEILRRKLAALKRQQALQLQILTEQRALYLGRQERNRQALAAMTVRAPEGGGIVVYETNYRNEKKYVGAQAYRLEPILQLPDLSTLIVRAQIAEADAGRLEVGQPVEVRLEALADETIRGRVASLASLYRRPVYNRPARVLDFDVQLEGDINPSLRPGMAARIVVTTGELERGVTVPAGAVGRDERGDFVWVQTPDGGERRDVVIAERSGPVAVILGGLNEGEWVAKQARAGGGSR